MNWIKMRAVLIDHPKVLRIGSILRRANPSAGAGPMPISIQVLGALFRFWTYADHQADGDLIPEMDIHGVDDLVQCPGFGQAMVEVGWLKIVESEAGGHSLQLVNYEEHNGSSAKKRAREARRSMVNRFNEKRTQKRTESVRKGNEKRTESVREGNEKRTGGQQRIDKNRIENTNTNPPIPPLGEIDPVPADAVKWPYDPQKAELPLELDTPAFRKAWGDWFIYRRESRQKPYRHSTIKRKLADFVEIGQARAIAAIEFSIGQGYIGIFEPPSGATGPRQVKHCEKKIHRAIDGLEPELRAKLESQAAADAARGIKPFDSLRKPAKPLYTPEETERFMADGRARAAKMAAFNAQLTQIMLGNESNKSDSIAVAVTKLAQIGDKTPNAAEQSSGSEKAGNEPISDDLPF